MKIYDGPDGSKWVEDGVRCVRSGDMWVNAITGAVCGPSFTTNDTERIILRLATPEEIAGVAANKRLCPGCGIEQYFEAGGWFSEGLHGANCRWVKTWNKHNCGPYDKACRLADEACKPGVHLTPESVGKAYRNGFTKVTVETRREGGYRVRGAYNHAGQAYWVKEDGKLADRCEAWAATFHNVKDKDLDLISEWDEKAEAGVTPEGAATPNACTAKPDANAPQGVEPDAPDRRAEHVPVAKAWVNPAMLGR